MEEDNILSESSNLHEISGQSSNSNSFESPEFSEQPSTIEDLGKPRNDKTLENSVKDKEIHTQIKFFKKNGVMAGKILTHVSEKPGKFISVLKKAICPHCSTTFELKSDLKKHWLITNCGSPFPCSMCDKVFALNSDFVKHVESTHMKNKLACLNNIKCEICDISFKRPHSLNRHNASVHQGKDDFSLKKIF